jgi:peroxiredoxin
MAEDKVRATPNLIVHFGDAKDSGALERITEALGKSGRQDASTSIVAVLPAGQIETARHVPGVVYVEQTADEWERALGVRAQRTPSTFVVTQTGKSVWQHEGEINVSTLTDTLRRVLVAGRTARATTVTSAARIGHAPPNFLFSPAAGHGLTLRKLAGRPVILVFWKSTARLSLEAARTAATSPPDPAWKNAVVLAINDGESGDVVTKAATAGFPATIVPDPNRAISRAFGVRAWPTLVFLDARGILRDVRHGLSVGDRASDAGHARDGYAS